MVVIRFRKRLDKWRKRYGFLVGVLAILVVVGGLTIMTRDRYVLRHEDSVVTSPWISPTVKYWSDIIDKMGERYDVDDNLIAIIMTLESGGYVEADSGQARGLMQVTPYTAEDISRKFVKTPVSQYDLFDPETSVEFGTAYLAHLRETFCLPEEKLPTDKCVEIIAAGYNGGPGAANLVYTGEGLRDPQTIGYARDALAMWKQRDDESSPAYDDWLSRGGQSLVEKATLWQNSN